jgi:hypothetical protein
MGELLLILDTPFAEDSGRECRDRAMLLLKFGVCVVEGVRFGTWDTIKGELNRILLLKRTRKDDGKSAHFINDPRTLVFLDSRLHLGKSIEHDLRFFDLLFIVAKELEGGLEDLSRLVDLAPLLFEFAPLDPDTRLGANGDPTLVNCRSAIELAIPLLQFDVSAPCLVVGLPLHPSLKHLPGARDVFQKFLEVDVLVPELIDAREQGDGTVKEVAGVLYVSRLELHFRVGEP